MSVSIVGTPVVETAFATALPAWTIPAGAAAADLVCVVTGSTFFAPMAVSPAMTQVGPVTSGSGSSSHASMYLFYASVAALGGAGATVTVSDGGTSNNLAAGFICLHSDAAPLVITPADVTGFANSGAVAAAGGTAPALANAATAGIVLFASHVVASAAIAYTAPAGYAQQAQGARAFASLDLCTKAVAAGATIGAATDAATASGEWVAGQFLIHESVAAAGGWIVGPTAWGAP